MTDGIGKVVIPKQRDDYEMVIHMQKRKWFFSQDQKIAVDEFIKFAQIKKVEPEYEGARRMDLAAGVAC